MNVFTGAMQHGGFTLFNLMGSRFRLAGIQLGLLQAADVNALSVASGHAVSLAVVHQTRCFGGGFGDDHRYSEQGALTVAVVGISGKGAGNIAFIRIEMGSKHKVPAEARRQTGALLAGT